MNEWTPANSHEEAANRIKTLELIPRLRKLYDVLLEGTNAYPGYDRLVAASDIERVIAENERLESIIAELLAACELVAGMNQFAFSRHVWYAVRDAISNAQPQGER